MNHISSILVTLLLVVGCSRQGPTPQQIYVLKSNQETQQLTVAGRKWGVAIRPWKSGGVADMPAAREALAELDELIAGIRQDFNARMIPPCDAAKEFHRETNDYLDWQSKAGAKCSELLDFIEANTPADDAAISYFLKELTQLNQQELKLKAKSYEIAARLGVVTPTAR
jgi:hypothetical protein